MKRNKYIYAIVAALLAISVLVISGVLLSKDNSNNTSQPEKSTDSEITESADKNVFFLNSESVNPGDEVSIILSLKGDVSICRYSIKIDYDNAVLELVDYDAELGALSPVVNPEKDEKGDIIGESNGLIGLEWANATNIKKASKIIEMKFKIRDIAVAKTKIELQVKGVSMLADSIVVDAEYSTVDSVITINQ